jgi:hypothetical protein
MKGAPCLGHSVPFGWGCQAMIQKAVLRPQWITCFEIATLKNSIVDFKTRKVAVTKGLLFRSNSPVAVNCCCMTNSIDGAMASVLASNVVDRELEPRSGHTKDYRIGICCCFSTKHAALMSESKDWLARN